MLEKQANKRDAKRSMAKKCRDVILVGFINFTCRKCNLEDLMPPKGLPGQIIKEIRYAFTKFSTEFPSATEIGSTEMF